jgi:hypothetical protein
MTREELRATVQSALQERPAVAVAADTGLSVNTIYGVQRANRRASIGTLTVLAEYLNIDPKGEYHGIS